MQKLVLETPHVITAPDVSAGRGLPLHDIRTPSDNAIAADFIMEEVRKIAANPQTRLIASIAGGRKTMGVLLYASMSLLGRHQDRLTHVLVNEPFDSSNLSPRFFFPGLSPNRHTLFSPKDNKSRSYFSTRAKVMLADIPFIRLRKLFRQEAEFCLTDFNSLVRRYSNRVEAVCTRPVLALDYENLTILVNGQPIRLSAGEFSLMAFLAEYHPTPSNALPDQKTGLLRLGDFLPQLAAKMPEHSVARAKIREWAKMATDCYETVSLRRRLSEVRRKLTVAGLGHITQFLLPQRNRFSLDVELRLSGK